MKKILNKKNITIITVVALVMTAGFILGKNNASAETPSPVDQIVDGDNSNSTPVEGTVVEEVESDSTLVSTESREVSVTNYTRDLKIEETSITEETSVKLVVLTTKKLPTIVGNAVIDANTFGVNVSYENSDITSSCNITVSNVDRTVGEHTVKISANCGTYGFAERDAIVNIYVPSVDEAPKASSNTDTSISTPAPKTEVVVDKNGEQTRNTRAVVEMTKVTIVYANGSQTTFTKSVVENVYATQTTRVVYESELPSNYIVNGTTLTVNGNTFIA